MATTPRGLANLTAPAAREARLRRWCLLAILGALLLGTYVGALAWATRTVEAGVARSIQPLPALVRDRPSD
jgi:hypothetical protein